MRRFVPLFGRRPRCPAHPLLVPRSGRSGDRGHHVAPRGGGGPASGHPTCAATRRPGAARRVVTAPVAGLSWTVPLQRATLLAPSRDLVRRRSSYPHRRSGRPAATRCTTTPVVRLACESPTWGYRQVHGELAITGVTIAASSAWAILKRHRAGPSPGRAEPSWAEFLRAQDKGIVACEFFRVGTLLVCRLYVLVLIHHYTRLVQIAGVTAKPVVSSVTRRARNTSMGPTDEASAVKFLIRDRDTRFRASSDAVIAAENATIIKSSVRACRENATSELVIGTLGASASTGCSSSVAVTWNPCSASTSSTTTRAVSTGPSASGRGLPRRPHLPYLAASTSQASKNRSHVRAHLRVPAGRPSKTDGFPQAVGRRVVSRVIHCARERDLDP